MTPSTQQQTTPTPRRDGWTPERRGQFLGGLAAGLDVRRACARVGLSREGAYRLRRREAAFARAWDEALRAAREAEEQAFRALMAQRPWALSTLSGECELRAAERRPATASHPAGSCELHGGGLAAEDRVRPVRGV